MKPNGLRHSRSAPALEWLCDLSGKSARITSMGRRCLLVENHCGILEYREDRIRLATRCGCLEIEGSCLSLGEVRRDAMMICGSIRNVKLPCPEAGDDEA